MLGPEPSLRPPDSHWPDLMRLAASPAQEIRASDHQEHDCDPQLHLERTQPGDVGWVEQCQSWAHCLSLSVRPSAWPICRWLWLIRHWLRLIRRWLCSVRRWLWRIRCRLFGLAAAASACSCGRFRISLGAFSSAGGLRSYVGNNSLCNDWLLEPAQAATPPALRPALFPRLSEMPLSGALVCAFRESSRQQALHRSWPLEWVALVA